MISIKKEINMSKPLNHILLSFHGLMLSLFKNTEIPAFESKIILTRTFKLLLSNISSTNYPEERRSKEITNFKN